MKLETSSRPTSRINEIVDALLQIFIAFLIAMVFRSFLYEPYKIPSSSMKPTLIIGDCIFISKFSYGFSRYSLPLNLKLLPESRILKFNQPQRGDVIVFRGPKDNNITYIKRLIGLPGDKIQVKQGIVYINGEEVKRVPDGYFFDIDQNINVKRYKETLPNGVTYSVLDREDDNILDNTEIYTVPDHNYFMMGDNRDQSGDSRVLKGIGYVDEKYLAGKAEIIFFSASTNISSLWGFFKDINLSRFFTSLIPESKKI